MLSSPARTSRSCAPARRADPRICPSRLTWMTYSAPTGGQRLRHGRHTTITSRYPTPGFHTVHVAAMRVPRPHEWLVVAPLWDAATPGFGLVCPRSRAVLCRGRVIVMSSSIPRHEERQISVIFSGERPELLILRFRRDRSESGPLGTGIPRFGLWRYPGEMMPG